MYEEFYNLTGKPFLLNPDPKFFFQSTGHKRAMAYMRYGLQQEQGFIVVTGDVGTGKSMLVSNLFKEIEGKDLVAAKIVSTNVKDVDLLRLISAEFDLPHERKSKAALLTSLEDFFRASVEEGKRVLLVIDEAQNMNRHEIKTVLTRVGEGTKIVLTGDIEQIDNIYIDSTNNGLSYLVEKFKDQEIAGHITLLKGERSKVASVAARIL